MDKFFCSLLMSNGGGENEIKVRNGVVIVLRKFRGCWGRGRVIMSFEDLLKTFFVSRRFDVKCFDYFCVLYFMISSGFHNPL